MSGVYNYLPTPAPRIEVDRKVAETFGMPAVNYDGLKEMYHGDFAIPLDIQPTVRLRPISDRNTYGSHMLLSKTVHIDPFKTNARDASFDLPTVLLHESQHLADAVHHPIREVSRTAGRLGLVGLSAFATYRAMKDGIIPDAGNAVVDAVNLEGRTAGNIFSEYLDVFVISYGISAKITRRLIYKYIDPAEKRARAAEARPDLQEKYKDVIKFPPPSLINALKLILGK